jgi:general secretion pathway protein G
MNKKRFGFTLIELIIVIVIIGILAVVAVPKYFANIKKAEKAKVLTNLSTVREAMLGYNAANGAFPTVSAGNNIIVTIDGDAVMTVTVPSSPAVTLSGTNLTSIISGCTYTMNVNTGVTTVSGAGCPSI